MELVLFRFPSFLLVLIFLSDIPARVEAREDGSYDAKFYPTKDGKYSFIVVYFNHF